MDDLVKMFSPTELLVTIACDGSFFSFYPSARQLMIAFSTAQVTAEERSTWSR